MDPRQTDRVMSATKRFETHRRRLLGLAYRMLGSRADAEDIVQDAWFKWAQSDHRAIENEAAFLTTVVSRLCLDRLKRERPKRLAYTGCWLPEPIIDADLMSACGASELADDLSFALLLALERLSALERAAFLLHDIFDTPFADVATAIGRSEAAVRQLCARARRALRASKRQRAAAPEKHTALLNAFMAALASSDADSLQALLREDVIAITDSGGITPAFPRPLRGARRVARILTAKRHALERPAGTWSVVPTVINGAAGIVSLHNETVAVAIALDVQDGRIASIYLVRGARKLAALPVHRIARG